MLRAEAGIERLLLMPRVALATIAPGDPRWAAFAAMLEAAGLPTSDLAERGQFFFAAQSGGEPEAFAGFAQLGEDALLRSIVVSPDMRGSGVGRAVVAAVEGLARMSGAKTAWLLTESPDFFKRCGYMARERSSAPEKVASSREFSTLCPSSASLMSKPLSTP